MNSVELSISPFQLKFEEDYAFISNNQVINLCAGDFVHLSGENGSGKSHLLQIIKGIIPEIIKPHNLTPNCILYNKKTLNMLTVAEHAKIAYLGQNPTSGFVIDHVFKDLKLSYKGLSESEELFMQDLTKIADKLGITNLLERKITSLSSGEQQMVNITRILLQKPNILLLDEFSEYLDDDNIINTLSLMTAYLPEIIVIIADHNPKHITSYINKHLTIYNSCIEVVKSETNYSDFSFQPTTSNGTNYKMLEVINLYFHLSHRQIFSDLNLCVNAGEIVGIYGENGSGKSSLLQLIIKQISPNKGYIKLEENLLKKIKPKKLFQIINILFTNSILHFFELTVEQEIIQLSSRQNINLTAETILSKINLLDKKTLHFSALSHGEQKRLALATILFSNAKILLLDNPFLGQDIKNRKELEELIYKLATENKKTIIVVSSKMSQLPQKSHKIYKISEHKCKNF
jgi:energy-coupling factor transporter ATP-binding protein EcfA2